MPVIRLPTRRWRWLLLLFQAAQDRADEPGVRRDPLTIRVLLHPGLRALRKAQRDPCRAAFLLGGGFGGSLIERDDQLDVSARQPDVDPGGGQLVAQLLGRLAQRIQQPQLERGLQRAGQTLGDGQRGLVRARHGFQVGSNGFEVRGQVHRCVSFLPWCAVKGRRVDRRVAPRFERSSASRRRSSSRSRPSSSRIRGPIGATSLASCRCLDDVTMTSDPTPVNSHSCGPMNPRSTTIALLHKM